jgi:nucleotide-binding universal stress UspA family protein
MGERPVKILLPIDGSTHALEAVSHAVALVRRGLQAEFLLVNAQPAANLYELAVAHDADVIDQVRSAAGADQLQPAEAMLQAAGLSFESEVVGGDPARVLIEAIEREGCDAVIMGTHGTGRRFASLFGSVSGALLQHSPVPVTVVRARGAAAPAADTA